MHGTVHVSKKPFTFHVGVLSFCQQKIRKQTWRDLAWTLVQKSSQLPFLVYLKRLLGRKGVRFFKVSSLHVTNYVKFVIFRGENLKKTLLCCIRCPPRTIMSACILFHSSLLRNFRNKELMHRFIGASSYARSQHRHLSNFLVIFELIKWTNSTHNSSQLHLETSFTAMSLQW